MVTLRDMKAEEQDKIFQLYEEAFPEIERKPIPMLLDLRKKDKIYLLAVHDGESDEVVGLSFLLHYGDMILFDYFAIMPQHQSKGYGAEVLRAVVERYPEKRIFGEVEPLDPEAPNAKQRQRRMDFYLRNGVKETGIIVNLFGCELQLMYAGDTPITYTEYVKFLRHIYGGLKGRLIVRRNVHFVRQM